MIRRDSSEGEDETDSPGQRGTNGSEVRHNGSGSDDMINEHFYDVPEVGTGEKDGCFMCVCRVKTTWPYTRLLTESELRPRR